MENFFRSVCREEDEEMRADEKYFCHRTFSRSTATNKIRNLNVALNSFAFVVPFASACSYVCGLIEF